MRRWTYQDCSVYFGDVYKTLAVQYSQFTGAVASAETNKQRPEQSCRWENEGILWGTLAGISFSKTPCKLENSPTPGKTIKKNSVLSRGVLTLWEEKHGKVQAKEWCRHPGTPTRTKKDRDSGKSSARAGNRGVTRIGSFANSGSPCWSGGIWVVGSLTQKYPLA